MLAQGSHSPKLLSAPFSPIFGPISSHSSTRRFQSMFGLIASRSARTIIIAAISLVFLGFSPLSPFHAIDNRDGALSGWGLHSPPPLVWPSPSELAVVEEDGAEAACDPYHAFGHLAVYPKVPEWNTWVPFDRECKTPALFRSLRTELGIESEEIKEINANEEELDFKDSWTQESLDFMSGRSVLLFGDSTSRNQLIQFCDMLQLKYHQLGNPETEATERASPHYCYSPKHDFLIVSVFHYGMDEDEYWRLKDMFMPPGNFEDRLNEIVVPIASDLAKLVPAPKDSQPALKRQFDLIQIATGLWDLARFAKLDLEAGVSTIDDLSQEQLQWWRSRIVDTAKATKEAFPDAKVVFRSMHYPSDKNAKLDWFLGPGAGSGDGNRPFFHHNRIYQLDSAARSAIIPQGKWPGVPGVEFNEWGTMLIGQHAHQMDQIHPGPLPAGWLGSDMILYELRAHIHGLMKAPKKTAKKRPHSGNIPAAVHL